MVLGIIYSSFCHGGSKTRRTTRTWRLDGITWCSFLKNQILELPFRQHHFDVCLARPVFSSRFLVMLPKYKHMGPTRASSVDIARGTPQ